MDGLGVGSHGSLLEGLGQGRVSVARPRDILARCAVLESQSTLSNHLTGVGANDVDTQQSVRLGVGEHLDHTLGVLVGLGSGVGAEGESSNTVRDLLVLEVLLALADPGNLGEGVHNGGNGTIVHVAIALLDVLDDGNGLLLSLVRKHRPKGSVTDASDMGDLGSVLGVDDDTATLVQLKTNVLKTQTAGVGSSTDGNENNVRLNLLCS